MITKNMVIDDILNSNPSLDKVFKDSGIKCFG